ncbi:YdcF family protein [Cohnella pontilimi]|uniref:YdcF family protein n=1 Tax=Cohnella pontilimi TaxID=2564100 RepID=A0A4V5LSS6_9BACL|nr:YdcF family protein [Cohnella pontilimi]TJY44239.1 YdcF family protein [Cohnella pontilimi]
MNDIVNAKTGVRSSGRARPRRLRILLRFAAGLFILLAIWCGLLYYKIVSFDGVPADANQIRADAGIVLGASLRNDEPSPGLRERLDHALALYRNGVFDHFIVTGGFDKKGAKLSEAEGMRDYLIKNGVSPDAIALDPKSYSTYENLRNAQQIMGEQGWRTAVIVTHRYHGARAADIAKLLGYAPVQVSVTDSKVMNMAYHEAREILAFTKWKADKLRLSLAVQHS